MELIKTNKPDVFTDYANECLAGHEGAVICVNDEPCVWTGQLATFDRGECEKRGLYIGVAQHLGGTIVNMPGDVSLCVTTWGNSEIAPKIAAKLTNWLTEKGLSATTDGNDTLVDGKKVISWARATTVKGWCQSVVHVSVGKMDLKLVRAVCTKPMKKTPGALSEYGITADDLVPIVEKELEEK